MPISPLAWNSLIFTSVTQFHPPACQSPTFLLSVTILPLPILNTLLSPRFNLQASTLLFLSAVLHCKNSQSWIYICCTPSLSHNIFETHLPCLIPTVPPWMPALVLVPAVVWSPRHWNLVFPLPWLPYLISREVCPTKHPVSSTSFLPSSSDSFLSLLKPYH